MSRRPRPVAAATPQGLKKNNVINTLFQNCQFNTTTHEKLLKKLKQEFDRIPLDEFFDGYIHCLQHLLVIGDKHSTVERALEFAAKFCVMLFDDKPAEEDLNNDNEEEMPPFLKKLFSFLFQAHQTRNQNIRFRVCQLINKLLNNLGEDASLDDEVCNRICSNMLERLQDKVPAVRAQAVLGLQRLQDPLSADCPVIKAYLFHLRADPSPTVRRAVLNCIGRSNITLPHILERTRDIKDTVRRHAYLVLTKLSIRSLTIKQRERLLCEGLKDRSELVNTFVATVLLPAWLRNMKGNYLDLLHAFDVENSTETSVLALKTLLKHRPLKEVMENLVLQQPDKLIPLEKLTSENALYWRCLAHHLQSEGGEELQEELENILPDLTPFCQYIRSFFLTESPPEDSTSWLQIQRQFMVLQLLELAKVFDLADELGRSNLKKLIYDMLVCTYVKEDLVSVLVQLLVAVEPNVNSRLQFLAEIISEVHEPLIQVSVDMPPEETRKKLMMQAKIRVQLNELGEEQEAAIQEQDFLRAQSLLEKIRELREELQTLNTEPEVAHEEVREERNDRATLSKCLTIVYEMMQSPTVTHLTPQLRSLMENFVMNFIEDCDTYVRSLALRAIGVFCLLDEELAKQYMLMFYFQLANNESDEVCIMSLRVIFDLFMLYGLQPFQMEEEEGEKEADKTGKKKLFDASGLEEADDDDINTVDSTQPSQTNGSTSNFITILTSLLDSTSAELRTVAAQGLCKLLLANRIKSPNLVSRLLIMWYNPLTEGDVYLRQMLGAFFSTFASNSQWGQETLEQAVLPTLRTLFQAPVTSPLVEVDQDSVVRLLLNLTRSNINQNGSQCNNVHNHLAIAFCNEVLVDQDPYNIQVLLRALSQLEITFDDPIFLQNVATVAQKVAETIKDKTCLRHVHRFQQILSEARLTLSTNAETTNTNTMSVVSEAQIPAIESTQSSSVNPEPPSVDPETIETDDSDSDQSFRMKTPHFIRGKRVVPETPDNSDSPMSERSGDTISDVQVDGASQQASSNGSSPLLRRSNRVAKRKSDSYAK